MTTFTIPFPPTVNHMIKSSGSKRYLSREYEAFNGMVGIIVKRERVPSFGDKKIALAIELCWPNKRKGDLDNRCKAVQDSLMKAGVMDDDSQVDQLHVKRGPIVKGGCAIVTVEAL